MVLTISVTVWMVCLFLRIGFVNRLVGQLGNQMKLVVPWTRAVKDLQWELKHSESLEDIYLNHYKSLYNLRSTDLRASMELPQHTR
jgi:hypothetical protein